MGTKNIINIPVESKRASSWEEYCDKMKGKTCYYVNNFYCEVKSSMFGDTPLAEEFDNKEDAVAFDAFCKLLKLRKDWVKDWKPDWTDIYQLKYAIANSSNKLVDCTCREISHPLSFPTEEMRDEFFNCFKDLLEQAKSLL